MGARPHVCLVFLDCLAVWGGGNCGKMEFYLMAFTLSPTEEAFVHCRKVDILLIADFLNIDVSSDVAKRVIKQTLHDTLIEMWILPEYSAGGEEDVSPDVAGGAMSDGGLPIVPAVESSIDPVLLKKLLPVALLSSVACELAPLRIVLLCVFFYLFLLLFLYV